jgi:hypothetical protein
MFRWPTWKRSKVPKVTTTVMLTIGERMVRKG